jgi:ketosteroid isomerase-like protein
MSQTNVEIIQRHAEAFLSGDLEAALAAYALDVVFDATLRPEGKIYRGRDQVLEGYREWVRMWDDWHLEMLEYVDADDRVLAIGRESGRGKGSGVQIDHLIYTLFTMRDGQITRWEAFLDRSEAYAAAGLPS